MFVAALWSKELAGDGTGWCVAASVRRRTSGDAGMLGCDSEPSGNSQEEYRSTSQRKLYVVFSYCMHERSKNQCCPIFAV